MKKGFTLLELLVVIAIIGILAAVGLGSYMTSRRKAADARARADLKEVQNALEQYYVANGTYPDSSDCSEADSMMSDGALPANDSYQYGCSGTAYYVSAELESEGEGNYSNADCSETSEDELNYFCVKNLQ